MPPWLKPKNLKVTLSARYQIGAHPSIEKQIRAEADEPQQSYRNISAHHSNDDCQHGNRNHAPGSGEIPEGVQRWYGMCGSVAFGGVAGLTGLVGVAGMRELTRLTHVPAFLFPA